MTVSITDTRVGYNGTGANTALATVFVFFDETDITVAKLDANDVETTLTLGVHYSVTGGNGATGTVTPIDGASDFEVGATWTLARVTPHTQSLDYVENDTFPAASHEQGMDRLTLQAQEVAESAGRALKYPISDSTLLSSELPTAGVRASKYLAFDGSGEPIASSAASGGLPVSTWIEQNLLDDTSAAAVRTTIDAQEDVMTTNGDLVTRAAGVTSRIVAVAAGKVLASTGVGSVPAWTDLLLLAPGLQGYIHGLITNRASATSVQIGVGMARDALDTLMLVRSAAITKTLSNPWVAGTGNAGLQAAVAPDTWYHIFLIGKPDGTVDAGFDTSLTAATLLGGGTPATVAGYTKYRRIGSFLTSAASQVIDYDQAGDWFFWNDIDDIGLDVAVVTDDTGGTTATVSVPTGIKAMARIRCVSSNGTTGPGGVSFTNGASVNDAPSLTAAPLYSVVHSATNAASGEVLVWTNTSAQITFRTGLTADDTYFVALGWMDPRGRTW